MSMQEASREKKAMAEARSHVRSEPQKDSKKDHGVLYLGVDLGTSRTSISASNGVRETFASVVGYPKDIISRKLLNRDVIYGDEALEKRLSLNLYRPLEQGVLKGSTNGSSESIANIKAAEDLLREAVRRARPRKDELVYAVIGAPAQASIHNKRAIVEAARQCVDSVMLCSEPFAVAYGLQWLEDVLVIDIGAGTTDLCRMHGTMPEDADQITIHMAGDAIDKSLYAALKEKHPEAQFTINMIKQIKERYAYVHGRSEKIVVELPVAGKPRNFDITDALVTCCMKIVQPIVDALGKLIASFDPEFQHKLRDRVLLAGGGSQIHGLDRAIEEKMQQSLGGGRVLRIEEPMYGGANGALKIAHDMPEEYWEKLK